MHSTRELADPWNFSKIGFSEYDGTIRLRLLQVNVIFPIYTEFTSCRGGSEKGRS
jgi:hypothetical protein